MPAGGVILEGFLAQNPAANPVAQGAQPDIVEVVVDAKWLQPGTGPGLQTSNRPTENERFLQMFLALEIRQIVTNVPSKAA